MDSNDSDHLYELIRGVPSVIVSSEASTTNNEYIPKRNLIGPNNFIGSKISKSGQSRCFIGGKGCVGTSFSPDEENLSETKFEVSLDEDFIRNCEFIVTLPILEGDSRSSSEGSRFRPKRGSGDSGESSEEEGSKPKGEKGAAFGGFFDNLKGSDDEISSGSDGGGIVPQLLKESCLGMGKASPPR